MIPVSDDYINALYGGEVIPKCEAEVKLEIYVGNELKTRTWSGEDFSNLTFKRSVDPLSLELPAMSAEWEEPLTNDLNLSNYPIDLSNLKGTGRVTITFNQHTALFGTWKSVKKNTWKQLKSKTWAQVLEGDFEKLKMPELFMNASPKIEKEKITWNAVGLVQLMSHSYDQFFDGITQYTLNNETLTGWRFHAIIANVIQNEREAYANDPIAYQALTNAMNFAYSSLPTENKDWPMHVNGTTADIVKNATSYLGYTFDNTNGLTFKKLPSSPQVIENRHLTRDFMFSDPEVTQATGISKYTYSIYQHSTNWETSKEKQIYATEVSEGKDNFGKKMWKLVWTYSDAPYATPITENISGLNSNDIHFFSSCSKAVLYVTQEYSTLSAESIKKIPNIKLNVYSLESTNSEKTLTGYDGDNAFKDENPLCSPYPVKPTEVTKRAANVAARYKKGNLQIDCEIVGDPSIEPMDFIKCDTGIYVTSENTEKEQTVNLLVTGIELTYSGILNEKLTGIQWGNI